MSGFGNPELDAAIRKLDDKRVKLVEQVAAT